MEIISERNTLMIEEENQQQQHRQERYQHKLFYVVQRCRHSGSHHNDCVLLPPTDMLRLFHSQREAEELAYHSARAFCGDIDGNSNGGAGERIAIKTILLPSYPAHSNPGGSSYGFVTGGGDLFWVRALQATIVMDNSNANTNSVCNPTNINTNNAMCSTSTAVYAILTEGVIGGSGNRDAQRGTEIYDGRVFGGDATARDIAMGSIARVQQQVNQTNTNTMNHPHRVRVEAKMIPIGIPTQSWCSSGTFIKDWPLQQVVKSGGRVQDYTSAMDEDDIIDSTATTAKRRIHSNDLDYNYNYNQGLSGWGRTVSHNGDNNNRRLTINKKGNMLVVNCPFEQQPAKRRRLVSASISEDCSINNNNNSTATGESNNNHEFFDYFGITTSENNHDDNNIMMQ
mmetsp:Transcript_17921/g.36898  ORF Transcript_17921/g.36898 Transcript_17921/m.36898 type:complete len:398 (-) Transcript_17921:1157-2350(-)|eukprot:CAMPEP_0168253012 /NCGR_PEP_ID=MMETSP0141_2-20121125/3940_1 /TAXON_ID=44445 /ORGANISM="Pseudo-nitzschia australis, Strain 10249 10 AB" /LENGTH=397 /DNA_ID=CAMNT_0008189309 /DNA_START=43 /DNA_END=1236 /DNA_ORIENTATION=-